MGKNNVPKFISKKSEKQSIKTSLFFSILLMLFLDNNKIFNSESLQVLHYLIVILKNKVIFTKLISFPVKLIKNKVLQ